MHAFTNHSTTAQGLEGHRTIGASRNPWQTPYSFLGSHARNRGPRMSRDRREESRRKYIQPSPRSKPQSFRLHQIPDARTARKIAKTNTHSPPPVKWMPTAALGTRTPEAGGQPRHGTLLDLPEESRNRTEHQTPPRALYPEIFHPIPSVEPD
ncbi:uncharacterized protein BJX67DRAFT_124057 [Aspergillus lucknowensis]|uniref:Uncharacterized protein n=1 Tax=Aspergillus lucknowensis TaxID=176173 RepID=A0ABR4LQ71_9EURO